MLGVDEDDFVVLVGGVLVDPVRVENPQVGTPASNTLLSGGLKRTLVLELVDSLVGGFSKSGTLLDWLLASTTSDTDTVDDISLLGLVTETAGLVWARWAGSSVDDI